MTNANAPLPTINQNLAVQITSPVGSIVVVGTSAVTVLPARAVRRGVQFFNPNAVAIIYVFPDNMTPVVGQGIPIFPGGGPPPLIGDGKLINYNCGWKAISDTAASPLTVLELL